MSHSSSKQTTEHLDLRGTPCPINFVRTKLHLEKMMPGQCLEVWLDAGEPIEQVPDSLTMEGYLVEQVVPNQDFYSLRVRCPSEA
jgi:TusA-related sulfurtransferase